MVRTKRVYKKNPFEPTKEENARWARLPAIQKKCKHLWMQVIVSDGILERLCHDGGEGGYDPLGMTIACISNPTKYAKVQHPLWKAVYEAAQAQLKFTRRIQRYAKKFDLNVLSIRKTCDILALEHE